MDHQGNLENGRLCAEHHPTYESETAAQARTLGGGEMGKATGQTTTSQYTTATPPATISDPRLLYKVARRYPILTRHWGLDDLIDELYFCVRGQK